MKAKNALSLALAAGIASTAVASNTPTKLDPTAANIRHAGHIYFNIATGEKITTLLGTGDAQSGVVGDPGTEIWINDTGAPCAVVDPTDTTSFFFGIDDPTGTTSLALNAFFADWGDIAFDTVVDCVQIHWISNHADTDTDSDGAADGVEGFAGTWTYWDAYNGRSPQTESIAQALIQFTFFSLPGEFPVDTATVVFFTADIDLAGSFGTSLTFELGDTDSDLQGAAVHNAMINMQDLDSDSVADIDPDGDGLADWAWSVQYNQPGTIDVDNADSDSDTQTGIDGDPALLNTAGVVFGSPTPGVAEFDSIAAEWNWVSAGPTAGATEDLFTLGTTENPDGSGALSIAGAFFFGGFDCSVGTPGYTPVSNFQTILYGPSDPGPGGCNEADLAGNVDGTPDGSLNFSDVSAFLALFAAGDLAADFAGNVDGTPDGSLNFSDVSAFLAVFSAGCP
ncbi:MAG: GC-type dockerin domain-anchored protein [Phycisphaerales bacterium]